MAAGWELPDDLIADVLRRLPPRSLAASRCVCRAWRDLVDARRLLRADLLPRSVGGIFINFGALDSPEFLSRPMAAGPSISGDLDFIQGISTVEDHCNGLLLIAAASDEDDYVANPAMRWRDWLPPCPVPPRKGEEEASHQIKCLAYDPTLSPHYEVFVIPPRLVPHPEKHQQSTWPPSPYALRVFSSMAGCWEERSFVLEGGEQREKGSFGLEEGGRVIDKLYWREALYVLCETGSGLRISMSNAKYRTIQKPSEAECDHHVRRIRLGISEKGVYCAFQYDWQGLGIFLLNESSGGQLRWELKQLVDLRSFGRKMFRDRLGKEEHKGPWVLQDINYYKYLYGNNEHEEVAEGNFEWESDDDMVEERQFESYTTFLGFHPYKEIVFLNVALRRAVAYHWNTSKFLDLGNICPKDYLAVAGHCAQVEASFVYTPCWMDGLPEDNLEARSEDCHE